MFLSHIPSLSYPVYFKLHTKSRDGYNPSRPSLREPRIWKLNSFFFYVLSNHRSSDSCNVRRPASRVHHPAFSGFPNDRLTSRVVSSCIYSILAMFRILTGFPQPCDCPVDRTPQSHDAVYEIGSIQWYVTILFCILTHPKTVCCSKSAILSGIP